MYSIVRFKTDKTFNMSDKRVIKTHLTLEEAQAHCKSPLTSSSTNPRKRVTSKYFKVASWFDGYIET